MAKKQGVKVNKRNKKSVPYRQGFPLPMDDGTIKEIEITSKDRYEWGLKIAQAYYDHGCLDAYIEGKQKAKHRRAGKTFTEVAEEWYIYNHKDKSSENTQTQYRTILRKHLLPVFGKMGIEQITPYDINDFFVCRTTQAKSTNQNIRVVLGAILKHAEAQEYIQENPMKRSKIKAQGTRKQERTALDASAALEAIALAEDDETKKFMALCFLAGLRSGEAYGLRWGDIDMNANFIHINKQVQNHKETKPKTKAGIRDVPISRTLREILEPMRGLNHLHVVTNRETLATNYQKARMREKVKAIAGIVPHEMRHTFATLLQASGTDSMTSKMILGHSKNATLEIYTHPNEQMLREAGSRFADYIEKPAMIEAEKRA